MYDSERLLMEMKNAESKCRSPRFSCECLESKNDVDGVTILKGNGLGEGRAHSTLRRQPLLLPLLLILSLRMTLVLLFVVVFVSTCGSPHPGVCVTMVTVTVVMVVT